MKGRLKRLLVEAQEASTQRRAAIQVEICQMIKDNRAIPNPTDRLKRVAIFEEVFANIVANCPEKLALNLEAITIIVGVDEQ